MFPDEDGEDGAGPAGDYDEDEDDEEEEDEDGSEVGLSFQGKQGNQVGNSSFSHLRHTTLFPIASMSVDRQRTGFFVCRGFSYLSVSGILSILLMSIQVINKKKLHYEKMIVVFNFLKKWTQTIRRRVHDSNKVDFLDVGCACCELHTERSFKLHIGPAFGNIPKLSPKNMFEYFDLV